MKAKNLLLSLGLATAGTLAYAYTDVVEIMTVVLKNGTTVEYKIDDVDRVAFETRENDVEVKNQVLYFDKDGNMSQKADILGFAKSTSTSTPTKGHNVYKATLDGDHEGIACEVTVDPAWVGKKIDLATIEKSASPVASVKYNNVQIYSNNEKFGMSGLEGTIEVVENNDGTVAVNVDIVNQYNNFGSKGGSPERVVMSYTGDCAGLAVRPENQVFYFNMDGALSQKAEILGFAKSVSTSTPTKGHNLYKATLDADHEGIACEVSVDPAWVGKKIDLATIEKSASPVASVKYNNIQIFSNNEKFGMSGLEGTIEVVENDDATVTINVDIVNKYNNYGSAAGTPERVVLSYTGACEGLSVAPEQKNEVKYFDKDGNLSQTAGILGFAKTTSTATPTKGHNAYTATLDADHEGIACMVTVDPAWVGKKIDLATIEKSASPVASVKYSNIQIFSNNERYGMSGLEGTIEVVENDDATVTINVNIVNKYNNYGSAAGTPERVVLSYTGACEGLSVAPEQKNEVKYFDKDGNLSQTAGILGFAKTTSTATPTKGHNAYTATLDADHEGIACMVTVDPAWVGKKIDLAKIEKSASPVASVKYSNIQIFSNNEKFGMSGLEGTIEVVENDDATVTINVDIVNKYNNYGTAAGTPERVVLSYTGACEGLSVAPEQKNEVKYFDKDGNLSQTAEVVGFAKGTSTPSPTKGHNLYTASLDAGHEGIACELTVDPAWIGKKIDLASVEKTDKPICSFKYNNIQIFSNNNNYGTSGLVGFIEVIENADKTVTINADVTNKYINWGTQGGTPERVVLTYKGACQGL